MLTDNLLITIIVLYFLVDRTSLFKNNYYVMKGNKKVVGVI